jgi:hypothetical protein
LIGREPGDRIEGELIVAFYRKRSGERLVPVTKTHRGTMAKLYNSTCIIEVPYRIRRV